MEGRREGVDVFEDIAWRVALFGIGLLEGRYLKQQFDHSYQQARRYFIPHP
jgi:hypothetical protein